MFNFLFKQVTFWELMCYLVAFYVGVSVGERLWQTLF